jgi:hypothetical protein
MAWRLLQVFARAMGLQLEQALALRRAWPLAARSALAAQLAWRWALA